MERGERKRQLARGGVVLMSGERGAGRWVRTQRAGRTRDVGDDGENHLKGKLSGRARMQDWEAQQSLVGSGP